MAEQFCEFYNMLRGLDDKEYMETFLSYNTSLICAGLKPSITLNLSRINNKDMYSLWLLYGESYIKELNLSYIMLRKSEKSVILLIYDEELLEYCINREDNRNFLISLGYEHKASLNESLSMLCLRYKKYKCPHELGIFLGYPLYDVMDFMNCSEKTCKACGYWKVYSCEEKARKVFSIFDNAKKTAAENIVKGYRKNQLSKLLRESFYNDRKIVFN